ncbi:hypothetical protein [Archangium sp.]|uniref:hypothetical protein n=1 Tax=Archangium sp. TaxID=1872627 RepID=UPI002D464EEA|nr:hypothetical protein [Archangium sp.]HYO51654.1 hypothetical protein [Archangium sp.]
MSLKEAAASPRGTSPWIFVAWAAVLAVVAARNMPVAHASHSHTGSNQLHISTIHGNDGTSTSPGGQDEQYCAMSHTSAVSSTWLGDNVQDTLINYPGNMWDGAANWRVDLWRTQKACNEYDSATRGTIEIEYYVKEDWWDVELCQGYYSCVVADNGVWDSVGGHTHYKWMYVRYQLEHIYNTTAERKRKFINHETGHVLGLRDPAGQGTDCAVTSVMHNDLYGCGYSVWYPTSSDLAAVTRVADRTNTY